MTKPRYTRMVVVNNPQGLHARPAEQFVRIASQFEAKIDVIKDSACVDGKSMLDVLTLAATQGTKLQLEAVGSDAEPALDALAELVENNFHEDEVTG